MTENHYEGRRLGRTTPPKKAPSIRLAEILKAVPEHPAQDDNLKNVRDWGMYGNDRYGDCGPVSVANSLKLATMMATGNEYSVSLDDVFDLYQRSGNSHFDPATGEGDNGVDMQTMLEALLKGGIAGRKPVAFASVDVSNIDEVRAAIAYFGVVLFGVNLETAQQAQTDDGLWDYSSVSGEWGGHAVAAGTYTSSTAPHTSDISVVTWAEVVGCSETFLQNQLDEAWVVVWPEHLAHPNFLAGVDVEKLAAVYAAITGKTMPIPTPGPGPSPIPTPVPGAAPFPGANVQVAAEIAERAARHRQTEQAWMNHHFEVYFGLPRVDGEF